VPAPATEALSDLEQDLAISLRELSNEEQLALRLSFQFELTHDEIAATLGWPLGTVKTQIARGKSRLRELMSAWRPRPRRQPTTILMSCCGTGFARRPCRARASIGG
jgi:RNA polymerase sigma-70 factor (ECF subfamily)